MMRCKIECFGNSVYNEETHSVWFAIIPDVNIPAEQQVDTSHGSLSLSMTVSHEQAATIKVGSQFYLDLVEAGEDDAYVKPSGSFCE